MFFKCVRGGGASAAHMVCHSVVMQFMYGCRVNFIGCQKFESCACSVVEL